MDDRTFNSLSDRDKLAYALGIACKIFGRKTVQQVYDMVEPAVKDMYGHGEQPSDPTENAWGGVWQIYNAE